jgi:hypothetical protein
MKNFRVLISAFIIIIAFSLNSCENEPVDSSLLPGTGNGGGTTTGYYFRVTKDGVVKQWSTVQALNTTVLNSFIFTAADSSTSMSLVLFDVSKIGVYNLSWAEKSCVYTEGTNIFSSDYSDFNTSAGNISITELNTTNKTIKGTFNFIGKNQAMTATKVFTKGEFFTTYTVQ